MGSWTAASPNPADRATPPPPPPVIDNMELALGWIESQASAMYDPSRSGFFLQWPNGTTYNEPEMGARGRGFGDQFFIDFRNTSAAAWYVESVLGAVSETAVDGTFADDVAGRGRAHGAVRRGAGERVLASVDQGRRGPGL